MERTDHPKPEHSPHTARTCNLCSSLRHPGLAAQGRALTTHLTEHPFPQQAGGTR